MSLKKYSRTQKITLLVLLILAVLYFVLFIPVNTYGGEEGSDFLYFSGDEYITYPYVEKMLKGGEDIHQLWGRLIIYGDYHYGYPFYFLSMLVLLPRRIIMGDAFFSAKATNILILRQMINVLPIILSAWILTYYKTRFQKIFQSVFLFLFFLIIPSVVRSNIWWWHPDSITFLFVALTFLFLQKDDYQLKKYFYFAAAACGLAAATKLLGFFFVITIPVYLYNAFRKKKTPWKKIIPKAVLFVCIMMAVIVLANPFVWYEGPRNEMLAIQQFKQSELREGYTNGDPYFYQTGPAFWDWTLRNWFGSNLFLCFLVISVCVGFLQKKEFNENFYLATWSFPFTAYVLFFVAPKPDHYIFPALMPMFLAAWDIPALLLQKWKTSSMTVRILSTVVMAGVLVVLFLQIKFCILKDIALFQDYLIGYI